MIFFHEPWQVYAIGAFVLLLLACLPLYGLWCDIRRHNRGRYERFHAYDAQQARLRAEQDTLWRNE